MSEENVGIFKRGVELWNRDDFDAWIEQYDPEVEWFALMEVYRGPAGVRQAWESFKADMQITDTDVRDLGDRVLGLGTVRSIGKGSGIESELPVAVVASFRDGLCTHVQDYGEHRDAALEAAGLSE